MAKPTPVTLVPVRANPQCVWVVVAGERTHKLTRLEAVELGVYEGDPWTQSLARRVESHLRAAALQRSALKFLGQRDHSSAALTQRLVRVGASAAEARRLLCELKEQGWLDDARACRSRCTTLQERGWSTTRVRAALEQEGFASADMDRVLAQLDADDRRAIDEAIGAAPRLPAARLYRRLVARGFDPEDVVAALDGAGRSPYAEEVA
ncbi:MAG: regulatory protein RecX [Planctomycetota bacterium]|nr:regulatory protein RecX [Planctomycetota bacterium]MDA1106093.1 regulatory protein RecX [Planctomycetota bacterium]